MLSAYVARYGLLALNGIGLTIELTVLSSGIGMTIGVFGAIGRISKLGLISTLTTAYVELVRDTPAIVQLFIVYYGLVDFGIRLSSFWAAVSTLGLFAGAYFTEIFRAGILSVDRGQIEAGQALGMSQGSLVRRVVLPQTLLLVLPPIASMTMDMLKATALVVTIGAQDLMYVAHQAASDTYRAMDFYGTAGVIYFALAYPISKLTGRLEKIAQRYGA
jgi:His/Glu/Gln/Arg/opine family amino acid ABC transporter permease subunit